MHTSEAYVVTNSIKENIREIRSYKDNLGKWARKFWCKTVWAGEANEVSSHRNTWLEIWKGSAEVLKQGSIFDTHQMHWERVRDETGE